MPVSTVTNLDYLIDRLRLHLGDTNATSYRYTDEWLRTALIASIKELMRWWSRKYLLDTDNNAIRNTTDWNYKYTSPPLIQYEDEEPIILMASIIIKMGSLENMSWNLGHWKDAEISYSNIEGGKQKDTSLKRDWKLLTSMLQPPTKRLKEPLKGSLPGYRRSKHESGADF